MEGQFGNPREFPNGSCIWEYMPEKSGENTQQMRVGQRGNANRGVFPRAATAKL
jgi:hypothetical protein